MPDESAKIILAVQNAKLIKVRDTLLIEDNINSIKCQFIFRTSDWDNTIKTAMFVRGHVVSNDDITPIPVLLDENNECNIPPEVLENNGSFSIGVWGRSEDYRIVSNWMYYKTSDGCFAEGSISLTPTPGIYEQILDTINNHTHINYISKEEVDNFIVENVNQALNNIFGGESIDAGSIAERS